jgi:hypothetical protein
MHIVYDLSPVVNAVSTSVVLSIGVLKCVTNAAVVVICLNNGHTVLTPIRVHMCTLTLHDSCILVRVNSHKFGGEW